MTIIQHENHDQINGLTSIDVDPLQLSGTELFNHIAASGLLIDLGHITNYKPLDLVDITERKLQSAGLFGLVTIDIVENPDQNGISAFFRLRDLSE